MTNRSIINLKQLKKEIKIATEPGDLNESGLGAEQVQCEGLPIAGNQHPLQAEGGVFLDEQETLAEVLPISDRYDYLLHAKILDTDLIPSLVQSGPSRESALMSLDVEGHKQLFWLSEPSFTPEETRIPDIYIFPFLSAAIKDGYGKEYHRLFAQEFPGARIITVATSGTEPGSETFRPRNCSQFNHVAMAKQRKNLINIISGNHPVGLIGLSIGGAIASEIAIQNLDDNQLDIRFMELAAPAVLTKQIEGLKSLPNFIKQIKHGVGEMLNPRHPIKTMGRLALGLRNVAQNAREPLSVAAFIYQGRTVVGKFNEADILRMLSSYPVNLHLLTDDAVAHKNDWLPHFEAGRVGMQLSDEKGHIQLANVKKIGKTVAQHIRLSRFLIT